MYRSFKAALVALLLACRLAHGQSQFETHNIEGWEVHLDKSIRAKEPASEAQVLKELQLRLREIVGLLPSKRIEELRRVGFYVHLEADSGKAGYTTREAAGDNETAAPGSIDLGGVEQFLQSQRDVPSRVLHELAHGYHFQVLGADDSEVRAAYTNAVHNNRYTHVLNWQGRVVDRSYALSSVFEYFALATQAYYERSGFYPFNRADLETYDPVAFELMRNVWENRPGPQPASVVSLGHLGHSCAAVGREGPGGTSVRTFPAILAIRNESQTPVEAWWLSGQGEQRKYADIAPGGLLLQRVFSPHVWQIRDQGNDCMADLHVGELGLHVTLQP